jgi:polysaccharide biosynthesis transport protein
MNTQGLPGSRPPELALPGFQPPAESEGIGLQDIVRILKQRRISLITTAIIVYILVVAGTFLTLLYFPAFTSEAIFELSPPIRPGLRREVEDTNPTSMEQMLQTEASKLRSLSLMYDVVGTPEMKTRRYFAWYEKDSPKCAEGLQKDLVAAPIPDSRLIKLALSTRDKVETRDIVKKVAEMYLQVHETETQGEATKQLTTLKNTLAAMNDELFTKRKQLADIRSSADVSALETESEVSREYVGRLKTEIMAIEADYAAADAQYEALTSVEPGRLPLTAEQQLIIESDPILRYFRNQVETLDVELQASLMRYGAKHRIIEEQKQRQEGFFGKEVARREELMNQVRTRQLESVEQEREKLKRQQLKLSDSQSQAESKQRDLDRTLQDYKQRVEDVDLLREQIGRVDAEYRSLENESKDKSRVRLRLVQDAREAVKASRPDLKTYLGGGMVLALAAGIGVAFLRELTDKAIRTPIDVARHGHLSVLGTIPLLDDEQAEVDEIENAVRAAPDSLVAESFRKVSTNLQFSGPADQQKSLLITSPSPGDGKSATAINLAITMAHAGQRVLLIDCNFRKPVIRDKFKGTPAEGLSNVLTGQASFESVVTRTDVPSLFVLNAGRKPPRPAELLGSPAMRELLRQAEAKFDRVILDGPPALLISDAVVLAMQVDGVILVARAETNTKGALKRAREQLQSINARIVGVVLNGVKAKAGGYFRQQYRDFYDYSSDETIPELPSPTDDRKA